MRTRLAWLMDLEPWPNPTCILGLGQHGLGSICVEPAHGPKRCATGRPVKPDSLLQLYFQHISWRDLPLHLERKISSPAWGILHGRVAKAAVGANRGKEDSKIIK